MCWQTNPRFSTIIIYTERKKKRNAKFDIDFQNNHSIYFHNFFTTSKSNQSLILIWEIIILSFESRHKAKVQNAKTQYLIQNQKKKRYPKSDLF